MLLTPSFIAATNFLPQVGMFGLWQFDKYNAAVGVVPNLLSTRTPLNLIRCPRRQFGNSNNVYWTASNLTIVDNVAVGPDGKTEASTIIRTAAGAWQLIYHGGVNLGVLAIANGTYTVAVNAKCNSGSSHTFKFNVQGGGGGSPIQTATTSWQRFSYTFTVANGQTTVWLTDAGDSDATDLQICDLEVFAGSSDLGPEILDGHLYVGGTGTVGGQSLPGVGNGYLDFSTRSQKDQGGLFQFGVKKTLTAFTVSALVKQSAVVGVGTNNVIMFMSEMGYTLANPNADFYLVINGQAPDNLEQVPTLVFRGGAAQTGWGDPLGTGFNAPFYNYSASTAKWVLLTFRYDGTHQQIMIDDTVMYSRQASQDANITGSFWNMLFQAADSIASPGNYCACQQVAAMAMWNRALSNSEVAQAFDYWKGYFSSKFSLVLQKYYFFADGSSLTAGPAAVRPYDYQVMQAQQSTRPVYGCNLAVSGSGLSNIQSNLPLWQSMLPAASRRIGRSFFFNLEAGINDLGAGIGTTYPDVPTYAADVATVADTLQGYGYAVYTNTVTDRQDQGGGQAAFNTNRAAYNTIITSSWGHGSGIIDPAANANLGAVGAANNTTYFLVDAVHENDTGMAIWAGLVETAINALP